MKKNISFKRQWFYGFHVVFSIIKNIKNRKIFQIWLTASSYQKFSFCNLYFSFPVFVKKNIDFSKKFGHESVHQGCAIETVSLLENHSLRTVFSNNNVDCCFVILDQVEDTRNIGAILRISSVFNSNGLIVLSRNNTIQYSKLLFKSASGSFDSCPLLCVSNLSKTLSFLKKNNVLCCGLDESGISMLDFFSNFNKHLLLKKNNLFLVKNKIKRIAFVLGRESKGLRNFTKRECDFLLSLPVNSNFSTLNVSSVVSILLFNFFLYLKEK